ncbi:MAG TPA: retropepsin-like aspartic protease [Blastocatellia bacterium]|nr:retropepsin-like aspartic protease [Blastocatellia bacterium]
MIEVPFEAESGWIVIPVSINSRPLRFVLDTGAQGAFLHNSDVIDSLDLHIVGKMPVRGVGGGGADREASVAGNVTFNIGGIELSNGELVVLPSRQGSASVATHDGVIGRPVFETMIVEVDWEKRVVRFYEPSKYNYTGSGTILPLTFDEGGRPYTTASIAFAKGNLIPVKLVVDSGASHALSLDVGSKPEISLPDGATKVVLGRGASGEVTGYIGRVKSLQLGGLMLENVPTVFPDSSSGTAGIGGRHGNLGADVLRGFKVIYHYSRNRIIIEPNRFFSEPFGVVPNAAMAARVSAPASKDYIGRYGNRTISFEDGAMYLQRQGGPKIKLVVVSKDEFTLEPIPAARMKFVRDENLNVTELHVLNRAGEWEKSKREP